MAKPTDLQGLAFDLLGATLRKKFCHVSDRMIPSESAVGPLNCEGSLTDP